MLNRLFSLCLLAAALAGCATVPNPLTPQQVEALRLTTVAVEVDPAAVLWWGDGDRAYARSKGLPEQEAEELSKTAEARAFITGMSFGPSGETTDAAFPAADDAVRLAASFRALALMLAAILAQAGRFARWLRRKPGQLAGLPTGRRKPAKSQGHARRHAARGPPPVS